MNNPRQHFHRTLLILNSLLFPVFILSLIEILKFALSSTLGLFPVLFMTAILKVYLLSGIGGCILEIVSTEEMVFRLRRFHQNARDCWPGFLAVIVAAFLIDFFLLAPLPALQGWRSVYFSLIGVIAAYTLAHWALHKKYLRPAGMPYRSPAFDLDFFLVMILAGLLELVLGRVSTIHLGNFYWRNISALMLNYIHAGEFIFSSLYILDAYPEINEKFNRKELFLINPIGAGVIRSLAFSLFRTYPPFFVVLKALSPKTYQFREFDQVIWHERYYKSNVLVCITCYTSNCYEAYKIAKEFKKRGSTVVMGGPHVTYLVQEALTFCDSVVIGQAEGVWGDVIRDYEKGELKPQYNKTATEADYAQVQRELLHSPPSMAKDFLETMRGCKFRCHFCTVPALSGGQVHLAPINSFIELIKKIKPHYSNLVFIDNNIYSDPSYAKELFTALKPLKIKWQSMCTIDIAKNEETLKLARESGCTGLGYGYEVSGGSLEKNQGGKFAMAQKYLEYTHLTKKAGIKIKGQFIFGFDSDNWKTLLGLWKFCFSIMPQVTAVSLLTPLPGSGLYRDMLTQDRIISLNWRSYSCYMMVVRHPQMNPAVVSFVYPIIQVFFFLTTSSLGIVFLLLMLFLPRLL